MFKKSTFIFIILISLGVFFAILSFNSLKVSSASTPETSPIPTPIPTASSSPTISPKTTPTFKPTQKPSPTSTPTPTPSTPSSAPTSTPTPTQSFDQVNLTINGGGNLRVIIESDSNQCDVLKRALEQGKISSLNMKYDNNLETYAVYQINGVGKETAVWWTYMVNGKSPSQGCSHINAKNDDNIEWKYIGS